MATSPLVALPAELRLRVYDFVLPSIPLSARPAQYIGLLCSCQLIRHELESEILKRMIAFLYRVQGRCRQVYAEDMSFEVPQNLTSLYNLQVTRPSKDKMFRREDPFVALLYMYFNTLTIHTLRPSYPPNTSPTFRDKRRTQFNMYFLARWIASREPSEDLPAARRIVYEWSSDRQGVWRPIERDCLAALERKGGWGMVFWRHRDDKKLGGAEFVREADWGEEVWREAGEWCFHELHKSRR